MNVSPVTEKIMQALGYELEKPAPPAAPVFLLGAGFSRAISEAMPTLKELSRMAWEIYELKDQVAPDIAELLQTDIEEALSLLLLSKPWVREAEHLRHRAVYLELSQVVAEVISRQEAQTIAELKAELPAWLNSLLRFWHNNRCTIITLNYDTLIERAAREFRPDPTKADTPCAPWHLYPRFLTNAASRNSGIWNSTPIETLRILKLHGSTNWFYSGRESSQGETIFFTCPTGPARFWSRAGQAEENQDRASVGDKYPFIVPPIFDKTPLMTHETIQSVWAEAAQALAKANRLFIVGYSLPKSDRAMRYFLQSNLNRSADVEIVSRSTNLVSHYEEALPTHKEQKKVMQRFSGNHAVRDLAAAL